MGSPALPDQVAAAVEAAEGAHVLHGHRGKDEHAGDGPRVPEDAGLQVARLLPPQRGEPEQDPECGCEEAPHDEPEEAAVGRPEAVGDRGSPPLEPDVRGTHDGRHEVRAQEVRQEVRREHLLVEDRRGRRRGMEPDGPDAEEDHEPHEPAEHEREEGEGEELRVADEDAQADPREMQAARQLGAEARGRRGTLRVAPVGRLRGVHPAASSEETRHKDVVKGPRVRRLPPGAAARLRTSPARAGQSPPPSCPRSSRPA